MPLIVIIPILILAAIYIYKNRQSIEKLFRAYEVTGGFLLISWLYVLACFRSEYMMRPEGAGIGFAILFGTLEWWSIPVTVFGIVLTFLAGFKRKFVLVTAILSLPTFVYLLSGIIRFTGVEKWEIWFSHVLFGP